MFWSPPLTRPAVFSAPALVFILAQPRLPSDDAGFRVTRAQNTESLTTFDVFEITFEHPNNYANPFQDVTIDVAFESPNGKQVRIGGFHYGSLQPPTIKLPPATGKATTAMRTARRTATSWTWTVTACRGPTSSPGTRRNSGTRTATAPGTALTRTTTGTAFPARMKFEPGPIRSTR